MKKFILSLLTIFIIAMSAISASAVTVTYTDMDVPQGYFFKSLEPRSAISNSSTQGQFINTWGYVDENGLYRCGGETDLGIPEDYYLVAMGQYYAKYVGQKFRITTDTGNVFYVAIGDFKGWHDTHDNYRVGNDCNDIVEFICNWSNMNTSIKSAGSANVYMPLNGSISRIERIDFIW